MRAAELAQIASIAYRRGTQDVALWGKNSPVLAIPGWRADIAGWLPGGLISYCLERDLSGRLLGLGRVDQSVATYAPRVHQAVSELDKPTLIGISLGGLIALHYAIRYGWQDIKAVVTIGCPFNGVELLKLLPFKRGALVDLTPGSQALLEIASIEAKPDQIVNVLTVGDNFVGNPHTIACPGKKVVVSAAGHNHLQYHSEYFAPTLDAVLN